MKKIFYCFLLLTFFVLSCSKEEADMDGSQNKKTENKEIKIILEAETSSQNIFAPIVFYQSFDGIKEQIDTITNSYNKWLYLFHILSC